MGASGSCKRPLSGNWGRLEKLVANIALSVGNGHMINDQNVLGSSGDSGAISGAC